MSSRVRALFALVLFACAPALALASDERIAHPGQIPSSSAENAQGNADRLTIGTVARDLLGSLASGTFANVAIVPNGGMYVAAQPASGAAGPLAVYQTGPENPLPLPQNTIGGLAADTTPTVRVALQAAPVGAIGPMAAPNSGSSVVDVVEAQIVTQDGPLNSVFFQQKGGGETQQQLATVRTDRVVYQIKSGAAAASPTVPATDVGWIAVARVTIPAGTTAISQSMISVLPGLAGFVPLGGSANFAALALGNVTAGCLQSDSQGNVFSQACTSGLGAVAATFPLSATTTSGTATIACQTCLTGIAAGTGIANSGGTTPTISLSHGDYVPASGGTFTGTIGVPQVNVNPTGTATSSNTNYASGSLYLLTNEYQNNAATTHSWQVQAVSNQQLNVSLDGTALLTLGSNGVLNTAGGIAAQGTVTSTGFAATFGSSTANYSATFSSVPGYAQANQFTVPTPNLFGVQDLNGRGNAVGLGNSTSVGQSAGGVVPTEFAVTEASVGTQLALDYSSDLGINGQMRAYGGLYAPSGTTSQVGLLNLFGGAFWYPTGTATSSQNYCSNGAVFRDSEYVNNAPQNVDATVDTCTNNNSTIWYFSGYNGPGNLQLNNGSLFTGSSTYGPGGATIAGNLNVTDVYAARNATTGVVFLGTNGQHYIYFDGTNYDLPSGGMSLGGPLGVNGAINGTNGLTLNANGALNVNVSNGSYSGMSVNAPANASPLQFTVGNNFVGYFGGDGSYNPGTGGANYGPSALSIPGTATASAFYVGSRRSLKRDIVPLDGRDALAIVDATAIVRFSYKREPRGSETHTGFIADDTSPVIAGRHHDHYDVDAVAAVDLAAIRELHHEIEALKSDHGSRAPATTMLDSAICGLSIGVGLGCFACAFLAISRRRRVA